MSELRDRVRRLDTDRAVIIGVVLSVTVVARFLLPVLLGGPRELKKCAAVGTVLVVILSAC